MFRRGAYASIVIASVLFFGPLSVGAQAPYVPEKITGSQGTPVTDAAGNPLGPTWQFVSRNRYVTDSAWSNDEAHFIIGSAGKNGKNGFKVLFDGATRKPIRTLRGIHPNYRWSMNPATPNRLYAIPADTDHLLRYEISHVAPVSGENESRISLPFRLSKDPQPKVNFAVVGGTEYIALLGSALPGNDAGLYIHVVMIGSEEASVIASYRADESACGHSIEAKCKEANANAFHFSPDGRHVFLGYNFDKIPRNNGWRLFDVDISSGTIRYHAVPQIASAVRKGFSKGFFNVNWGPAMFVPARGMSDSYLVGTLYDFWNGQVVPEIRTVNPKYKAGKVIKFDIANDAFYSLTDPEGPSGAITEASFMHVSGTNYLNPGYVAVSYDTKSRTAATSKFKGKLVAINVDAPSGMGTIEIATHGAQADGCYDCQVFLNMSPSGREIIYSTNGGSLLNPISEYAVRLPDEVRAPAPGNLLSFHIYQPPLLRSDLRVSSISEAAAPTSTVRFTVKIKNAGPDKSFKSVVRVRFPAAAPVAIVSVSDNCAIVPDGADCSIFTVNPNAAKTIRIQVRALSCPQAPYSFTIDLANEGTDTNMANNHSDHSPRKTMRCLPRLHEPFGKRGN